jgi:antitoxin (DNA-binding transcriptional repressor) of toxin-antitoxin stability system
MKHVGIFEAKTHLSSLLDEVEKGGEVTITRHGKPVAKAPAEFSSEEIERRHQAINRIRERAREISFEVSHKTIKRWINEGRH